MRHIDVCFHVVMMMNKIVDDSCLQYKRRENFSSQSEFLVPGVYLRKAAAVSPSMELLVQGSAGCVSTGGQVSIRKGTKLGSSGRSERFSRRLFKSVGFNFPPFALTLLHLNAKNQWLNLSNF